MTRRRAPVSANAGPSQDEIAAAFAVLLRAVNPRPDAADGRPEPLMTREEAAEWARIHPDTLDRWRGLGLASYGEGRIRRYRGSDILAFLAKLEREGDDLDEVSERARRAAREIREVTSGIHS